MPKDIITRDDCDIARYFSKAQNIAGSTSTTIRRAAMGRQEDDSITTTTIIDDVEWVGTVYVRNTTRTSANKNNIPSVDRSRPLAEVARFLELPSVSSRSELRRVSGTPVYATFVMDVALQKGKRVY